MFWTCRSSQAFLTARAYLDRLLTFLDVQALPSLAAALVAPLPIADPAPALHAHERAPRPDDEDPAGPTLLRVVAPVHGPTAAA
jgi:hypothetical protein